MASREVSTMIKQGFISDPSLSSLIHNKAISPKHIFSSSPTSSPSSSSPSSSSLSPPPPPAMFSSPGNRPTLFEMMSEEQLREAQQTTDINRRRLHEKLTRVLAKNPNFIDGNIGVAMDGTCDGLGLGGLVFGSGGDVKLTVSARDGFKVSMDVHRRVLTEKSRFFAEKLTTDGAVAQSVEICDCDDVEIYVEAVILMYSSSRDLKRMLMGEEVPRVLSLLMVSSAIMFEAGISACLEYLEAVPWSEEEEERVICCLSHLELHHHDDEVQVLQRVLSIQAPSTISLSLSIDQVLLKLLTGVLQAKDEKARKEMKTIIFRLLSEEDDSTTNTSDHRGGTRAAVNVVSKDTLYHLCHGCLSSLILCLSEAAAAAAATTTCMQDRGNIMGEIAREADNMRWIVDILIDRKMGDEFVKLWADQKELAALHSKIPTMYRHDISGITAQLCIAIGIRGQILVPRSTRYTLLSTWLEPLYEDFGWMRRACRPSIDKKLVEDGVSQTILTLSMPQQQSILLKWFDRFLNKGDDCPNIHRAFEIWWRRAFIRQQHYAVQCAGAGAGAENHHSDDLQITTLHDIDYS
ncbi:hypothetical protein Dimus_009054 [Dionaea muscipula]